MADLTSAILRPKSPPALVAYAYGRPVPSGPISPPPRREIREPVVLDAQLDCAPVLGGLLHPDRASGGRVKDPLIAIDAALNSRPAAPTVAPKSPREEKKKKKKGEKKKKPPGRTARAFLSYGDLAGCPQGRCGGAAAPSVTGFSPDHALAGSAAAGTLAALIAAQRVDDQPRHAGSALFAAAGRRPIRPADAGPDGRRWRGRRESTS